MGKLDKLDVTLGVALIVIVYSLAIIHPVLPVLVAAFGAVAWVAHQYKLKAKRKADDSADSTPESKAS